jgi:O-antigen/teichoic acid export membrane protein
MQTRWERSCQLSIRIGIESWNRIHAAVRNIWSADSFRGRFARGAVWSFAGAILAQSSNLIAFIITARLLGRQKFGEYGMIQSTVGMLGLFAGMGLGTTATKYVAEFRNLAPERAGRIIALGSAVAIVSGGLLSLVLLIFAPLIAGKTLNAPELSGELRIASALLFFNAFNGSQMGAIAGFEAFRAIARINLLRGLIAFPIATAAVFLWRLPGSVWALAITAAVTCVLSNFSLRRECRKLGIHPELRHGYAEGRILWAFSIPVVLMGALAGPAMWAADTMLVNQPHGYTEMALFSAANQWRSAILFAPLVLAQFALPLLSNLKGESNLSRYEKTLKWHLILTAGVASAAALPVALGSPLIMGLYGHGFRDGWLVLVLSAATAVVACLNGVVGTAILSAGSVWAGCAFNGLWAVVFLAGSYWLIPRYLALGLALSLFCAYLAHAAWQGVYLLHTIKLLARTAPCSAESPV